MDKVIEKILKIPLPQRIALVAAAVVLVTVGNYFLLISDLEDQIVRNTSSKTKLEKDLVDKKVIADNLNIFKRDKEVLERKLAEALTELPNSKDIDELLRQFNDIGKKSGLEIVNLEPQKEAPQGFYAAIPVKMEVAGNFHEIAVFFESISKLRRIVNVNNLSFGSPSRKNEKVVLKATYLATTFRFLDPSEQKDDKKGKKK